MLLKDQVEQTLKDFPETRNSDLQLTFRIISVYLPNEMKKIDGQWFISTKALKEIREDNCKRYRATFNSKGFYMPTDEQVLKQRKLNEKEWHESMSPSNPSLG